MTQSRPHIECRQLIQSSTPAPAEAGTRSRSAHCAASITPAHLAMSALMRAANSVGVLTTGSNPSAAILP